MSPIRSVVRRFGADHPSFAGHFPGQPVLPGVVLLAEVMEALCGAGLPDLPGERFDLRAVKFLWPVRPGDEVRIDVQGEAGRARFEVHCGDKVAASGQVVWSAA